MGFLSRLFVVASVGVAGFAVMLSLFLTGRLNGVRAISPLCGNAASPFLVGFFPFCVADLDTAVCKTTNTMNTPPLIVVVELKCIGPLQCIVAVFFFFTPIPSLSITAVELRRSA